MLKCLAAAAAAVLEPGVGALLVYALFFVVMRFLKSPIAQFSINQDPSIDVVEIQCMISVLRVVDDGPLLATLGRFLLLGRRFGTYSRL